jgi:NitT/TauT family transport system substrate-binding protein
MAATISALILVVGLAACGDSDDDSGGSGETTTTAAAAQTTAAAETTSAGASETTAGATETTAGESAAAAEPASFTVCFQGSNDVALLTMLETIEEMNAAGHDVETAFVAETELCTDGVTRDVFQIATGLPLTAVEAGADNLRAIGARNINGQLIVAQAGITSCDDLDGKSYAIHSTGSVMAALFRRWKAAECSPDTEITEVVVSGSGNRTNAIMAGEVDAAGVEGQDEPTLAINYAGQYEIVERFSESEPDFVAGLVYTNTRFLEEEPAAVQEYLRRMTALARQWQEDPAAYAAAIDRHLPDMDPTLKDYYINELGATGLFTLNGNVDEAALEHTLGVYHEAGTISEIMPVEEIADLSYLRAALDELGVELAVENQS